MPDSPTALSSRERQSHNYAAAFVSYLCGSPLEEVAQAHDIPLGTLEGHASRFGWCSLVRQVGARVEAINAVQPTSAWAQAELDANRKKNWLQVQRLLQLAENTITGALGDGTGELPPKMLKDLATSVSVLHDLGYRALGDIPAKRDAASSDRAAGAVIHVHLPALMAQPRPERVVEITAHSLKSPVDEILDQHGAHPTTGGRKAEEKTPI